MALSVATVPAKPPVGAPVDEETRQLIADRLSAEPLLSHRQLASEVGVSHEFVNQIAKKINGSDDLGAKRQKSLQRQLAKVLPVSARAMVIAQVAKGEATQKLAFAQIAAVKMANELDNVVTEKDRREKADNAVANLPVMFQLPDNTSIDIGIRIKRGK